ncbi:single-stranded DNA-binding protein [Glutamicibacter ardleyensis]|uniref:single-stranded DNA-binding protein n=1 Tax=Glutamicibacter ardleyensis TaxID=225894 RepID=UPI003FD02BE9
MSLNVNIPLSGQLTSTDDLQLRENTKGTAMLYFKLAVKESDKSNGREKTHFLSCVAHGKKAENLMYSVRNGLITTRTRLSVSVGIDTYSKKMIDPATSNTVDVQQTSYTVWELGVSAQFAPIADVSSPGFQQLINQMNQQTQGGFQNQNQQGYAPQQPQGGFQNQNQQGYAPQQPQGGFPNQNQQGYAPQQPQGGFPNQNENQQGYPAQEPSQASRQEQAPQQGENGYQNHSQAERAPQAEQGKSMRDEPLLDGEDF